MKAFFNIKFLIRICLQEPRINPTIEYLKAKKIFGITIRKEGFYDVSFSREYLGSEAPEGSIVVNGLVHTPWAVSLYYMGGINRSYDFDTEEAARAFKNQMITLAESAGAKFYEVN